MLIPSNKNQYNFRKPRPALYPAIRTAKGVRSAGQTVKYHMGWFNNDKSGDRVDWDGFDQLNNPSPEPEDRGVIEAPANSETIIYEAPDGQTYEIPVDDLIEADDDNEIEYGSASKNIVPSLSMKKVRKVRRSRNSLMVNGFGRPCMTSFQRVR